MRITDKIKEIKNFVDELEDIIPESFEEYKSNFLKKAACERYFEKILEALVDLAFLVIKEENLKIPEEDKHSFDILLEKGIISIEMTSKLKNAKGMRNIIAHEYGSIDDEIVFNSISTQLAKDTTEFLKNIKGALKLE